ncbi:MAG: protein kinase [candidate division Zixibacteria bacterium]|nr:protein kinase [candidate division Zixibacteria bacterium]
MIGQTISHYTINAKLGAGGMGEVYLAEDGKLGRQVALKFLPDALWHEGEAQQRLVREAKAASQLDHPNIVTIHGLEEHEGRPYIIMARVRGAPLNEYCTARPRTADELTELARQMADALHHAHEHGVIHRDLKPSNVLVDDGGRVRVLDFGIASLRGAARLTQTGSTVGTLAYSAPELARGQEATPTADVYSLGVVMYQMLTGRLPFDADHEAALLYSILNEPPIPFAKLKVDVPEELQTIVMKCLEKSPEDRFESCGDVAGELRRIRPGDGNGSSQTALDEKPSIAVLPFANMSNDPDNEYFSDGLTEELLNVLAKNPGLKVTGRTSSFSFKGKLEDLRGIGQKLGVEHLLEGSVRKAGNRVRITTQLVKASDGFHLWSETYDRVIEDIFAVQDEIASAVSEAMHVTLLGHPTPKPKPAANPDVLKLVLQANQLLSQITRESVAKSIDLFSRAIALDPNDARAWAGLSLAYGTQMGYGFVDSMDGLTAAREAAERALSLDETLPEVHNTIGWMNFAYIYDWERAGRSFQRALELAPSDGRMFNGLAVWNATMGNFDEALRLARDGTTLDPLNPSAHLYHGRAAMSARRYDEAWQAYEKALELSPGMTTAYGVRSAILSLQGRYNEALTESLKEQVTGYRTCTQAIIYYHLGRQDDSDRALAALMAEGSQWGVQIAMAHAQRNEPDQAFEWLERAYELRDAGISILPTTPALEPLHDDPRWKQLLKKVGLPFVPAPPVN